MNKYFLKFLEQEDKKALSRVSKSSLQLLILGYIATTFLVVFLFL